MTQEIQEWHDKSDWYVIGAGGGGCFLGDTLVSVPNGQCRIDKLQAGDVVLSFDDKGIVHEAKVLKVHEHENETVVRYRLWGGQCVDATPNHWVLNQFNAFVEIGSLGPDGCLIDINNHLRPIVSKENLGPGTVYNLTVEGHHTFIANNIRVHNAGLGNGITGAGGGGGKGGGGSVRTPTEDPDTIRSSATAAILAALCEGQVEGFATGRAETSVFLNDTPLESQGGDNNFGRNVEVNFRRGTQNQSAIPAFDDVRIEQSVGIKLERSAGPTTVTTTSSQLTNIVVRVGVGALYRVDADDGDVHANAVSFSIDIFDRLGARVGGNSSITIRQKSRGPVDFEYPFSLSGEGPWSVRVEKTSDDPNTIRDVGDLFFKAIVGIIPEALRYPNTALCGVRLRAEGFSSIPKISVLLKGTKIKVPANYDTAAATYSGIWDGSFKTEHSNNPAWIFFDLLTNPRYGCGQFITPTQIDKFTLYEVGRYCDERVSDGKGGTERRFVFDGVINNRGEAYQVLNGLAAAFRGMLYYADGRIIAVQDRPRRSVKIFDSSNVIIEQDKSGQVTSPPFVYEGTGRKARKTVALVSWNDPDDKYKAKIEYIEDREAIEVYGYREVEVRGFGCTSASQAQRIGRWTLVTNLTEKETVTFKTTAQGLFLMPGDVIEIADSFRSGGVAAGIVASGSTTTRVELDREVVLSGGTTYKLATIIDNTVPVFSGTTGATTVDGLQEIDVSTGAGTHTALTVVSGFASAPGMGQAWFLRNTSVSRKRYRVTALQEEGEVVTIVGTAYNNDKYAVVDDTAILDNIRRSIASLRVTPAVASGSIILDVG